MMCGLAIIDRNPNSGETLCQTIDISTISSDVDNGNVMLDLSGYMRIKDSNDNATLKVEMLDANNSVIGDQHFICNPDAGRNYNWMPVSSSFKVLAYTKALKVSMIAVGIDSDPSHDAIDFGGISLTLSKTLTVGTSGTAPTFIQDGNPVNVDSNLTVNAIQISSATVGITGNFRAGEDILQFTNTGAFGNISASYNSNTGILTLTSSGATATLAQWQAALRAVAYLNSTISPSTSPRRISFSISDGVTVVLLQIRR